MAWEPAHHYQVLARLEDDFTVCPRHRLDRGDLRFDVLGQNRRADPPAEAGAVRPAEGAGFQAADRQPLRRTGGGQSLTAKDLCHICAARLADSPSGGGRHQGGGH